MKRSSQFDYTNVVARLRRAAEEKRKRQGHTEKARLGQGGEYRRRRYVTERRPSLASRLMSAMRDEPKQLAVASVILLGFGAWICSFAIGIYNQRAEAALASACHKNNLAYAGETYCYDKRMTVHAVKDDGTTKRPGLDWGVNERSHRMAESQARVIAREAQEAQAAAAQYAE